MQPDPLICNEDGYAMALRAYAKAVQDDPLAPKVGLGLEHMRANLAMCAEGAVAMHFAPTKHRGDTQDHETRTVETVASYMANLAWDAWLWEMARGIIDAPRSWKDAWIALRAQLVATCRTHPYLMMAG